MKVNHFFNLLLKLSVWAKTRSFFESCFSGVVKYKKTGIACLGLIGLLSMAYLWAQQAPSISFNSTSQIQINRPEVIVQSQKLYDLPKDMLKVDLLKAALTEDFLFFYNTHIILM
jgi:uncharacterized protein YfaA (DUF2138 family)